MKRCKSDVNAFEKILMLGKIEGGRRRGRQRMRWVGWHHRIDVHEFEKAPGVGDGQGSLVCYSPQGHKRVSHDKATKQQL